PAAALVQAETTTWASLEEIQSSGHAHAAWPNNRKLVANGSTHWKLVANGPGNSKLGQSQRTEPASEARWVDGCCSSAVVYDETIFVNPSALGYRRRRLMWCLLPLVAASQCPVQALSFP